MGWGGVGSVVVDVWYIDGGERREMILRGWSQVEVK